MKAEDYKSISTEKPKRKGKLSTSKRLMLAAAQEWKLITSPKLCEAYSSKTEWAKKLIPKLKKEAEAPKKKKSLDKHTLQASATQ